MDVQRHSRIIVMLLLLAVACQCILSMSQKSATSDEVPHLAAGYAYLTRGDYRLNPEHPPLIKLIAAIPLLALDLDFNEEHPSWKAADQWAFGEEFINNNRVSAHRITFAGRLPVVGLSVLLALLVFRWAKEIYGTQAGVVALVLYAFSPNILAHSRLVTFDLPIALLMLLSVFRFHRLLVRPDVRNGLLAGVALGLGMSSKFSALNLVPVYLVLTLVFLLTGEKKQRKTSAIIKSGGLMFVVAIAIIVVAYRVTAFGDYFDGLRFVVEDVKQGGRPNFLFGQHSTEGWAYYFLAAMLLKTPIPSLVLTALAVAAIARRRSVSLAEYCLIVPIVLFLGMASFSRLQLGLRYVLPVYPFLFILASGIVTANTFRKLPARAAIVVLLGWYVVSTLLTFPHYIPYFNEFAGGPKNGYKYLLDSNVDWGQDLPALKTFLEREGSPEVILSFFGTASPRSYGIQYQDFYSFNRSGRSEDHINSVNATKEFFVLSVNALECLYFPSKNVFDWLKRTEPIAVIGYSLVVYDVTDDWQTHCNLGAMYLAGNHLKKAERQFRRALAINPDDPQATHYLGLMPEESPDRMPEPVRQSGQRPGPDTGD